MLVRLPCAGLLLGVLGPFCTPAAAANLAGNGGFEQPPLGSGVMSYVAGQTFGAWTVEAGGVDQVHRTFWFPYEGNHSLDLNGSGVGGIRQTIATQPGQRYGLTFAFAGNPGCTPGIRTLGVYWGGPIAHSVTFDTTTTSTSAMGWTIQSTVLLDATEPSTELAFRALSPLGACGPALDRVELVPRLHADRGLRLVSAAGSGTGNGLSEVDPRGNFVSADGRFVAFAGEASDLVPNDTNAAYDVFVRDLLTGTTELISRKAGTTTCANGDSSDALLSADGRWVAFLSRASDLATSGPNPALPGTLNLWLHDRQTRSTRLVSVDANGGATIAAAAHGANRISDDGRYLAFSSRNTNVVSAPAVSDTFFQIYLRDMATGTTTLVSHNAAGTGGANAHVSPALMSRDGRWLVFGTESNDVAPGDANAHADAYLHDRTTGLNVLVSKTPAGVAGNARSRPMSIADDGSRIALESSASDLVAGDANGAGDVFVYERATATVGLASCAAACSASANGVSERPLLSGNGRYVLFDSSASDLVAGDTNGVTDAFLRDLDTGTVERISAGAGPGTENDRTAISADGRWIGFHSSADLTADDATTSFRDFFVRDRASGATYLVNRGELGSSFGAEEAAFAAAAPRLVFSSDSDTLVAPDANDGMDVFAVDLTALDRLFGDGFE